MKLVGLNKAAYSKALKEAVLGPVIKLCGYRYFPPHLKIQVQSLVPTW